MFICIGSTHAVWTVLQERIFCCHAIIMSPARRSPSSFSAYNKNSPSKPQMGKHKAKTMCSQNYSANRDYFSHKELNNNINNNNFLYWPQIGFVIHLQFVLKSLSFVQTKRERDPSPCCAEKKEQKR